MKFERTEYMVMQCLKRFPHYMGEFTAGLKHRSRVIVLLIL